MQVDALQLDTGKEQLDLYRRPGIHSLSPNWSFRSPIAGPADKTKVGLLLMALEGLKAVGFVDSESEKQQLLPTLGAPIVTANVHMGKRIQSVRLYKASNRSHAYAVTLPSNPIYRIEPDTVSDMTKGLYDLRDKRLLGIETKELAILRVMTPSDSYTLINQSGEWVIESDPAQALKQDVVRLFVRPGGRPSC